MIPLPPALAVQIDALERLGQSRDDAWQVPRPEGEVLAALAIAHRALTRMPDAIDLAFIDADKPSTRAYFDLLWPKVRVGGSVLTDNVLTHRNELAGFIGHVRARADAHSVQLPVGGGLEWTLKV